MGKLTAVIATVPVIFSSLPSQLLAQSYPGWQLSLEFPLKDSEFLPGRRHSDGRGEARTPCPKAFRLPTKMTALMPPDNLVTTVAAHPTLFIYIPGTGQFAEAELAVYDEQDNTVYRKNILLPKTPGILRLSLPETVSLEIGKNYLWYFSLMCDPDERSREPFVQGWFQRTELNPELQTMLEKESDLLEQALLYCQAKIWHETLTLLADLRESNPAEWEELLKSVELEEISQQPFVDCCLKE
ncbi:MAG: DUF928 domain-containing protein [Symploca sp. SIO2G7]|nr:DUF928 domain-containing protein [Symploca sp. SIO2G7]